MKSIENLHAIACSLFYEGGALDGRLIWKPEQAVLMDFIGWNGDVDGEVLQEAVQDWLNVLFAGCKEAQEIEFSFRDDGKDGYVFKVLTSNAARSIPSWAT